MAVRVRGLSKSFGEHTALKDLTLDIPAGQLVALVGESGSGKSTLLRHLNGLHHSSQGAVEVLGIDVGSARGPGLRALRRRVGFVFQQFHLVGMSTCLENVLTGSLGRLKGPRPGVIGYPVAERRNALAELERVGLGDRAFQRTDTLSGGEQQRVAIARALMQRPQLMLADEPVASLDPETSAQVMDLLLSICHERNLTVLCSLHQVDMALGWCQRVVGLRGGRLELDASTVDLQASDLRSFYLGSPEVQTQTVSAPPLSRAAAAARAR
jgi:phosphonate transport system ATP-binding protein